MQCPNCLTFNSRSAQFCEQCGTPLDPKRSRVHRSKRVWLSSLILLALGGALFIWFQNEPESDSKTISEGTPAEVNTPTESLARDAVPPTRKEPNRRELIYQAERPEPLPREETPELPTAPQRLSWGLLTAQSPRAFVERKVAVPVFAEGWIVVPTRWVLGTSEWSLEIAGVGRSSRFAGPYPSGDSELTLWRSDLKLGGSAPALERWNRQAQLRLGPLEHLGDWEINGDFAIEILESSTNQRMGALFAQDRAVGAVVESRRFGEKIAWAYTGPVTDRLDREASPNDLFQETLGGGREEALIQALEQPGAFERVAGTLEAFQLDRLRAESEIPELTRERVLGRLYQDIKQLKESGQEQALASLLTLEAVGIVGSDTLLVLAVQLWAEVFGEGDAIELAEHWWPTLVRPDGQAEAILLEQIPIYNDQWLYRLIENAQWNLAWEVYEAGSQGYPKSAAIHLRGVELMLSEEDWQGAERFLNARTYPVRYSDRVRVLEQRIRDLKALAGKIVIRFRPGSQQARAIAQLNRRYDQNFIVDTGATITTIPKAAADSLGIRIRPTTPHVYVNTAGGTVLVPQVTLDSLTIGGWELPGIEVLVHDLPGSETLGLLGINVLKNFRVDLRTEEGLLILEPR